MQNMLVYGKSIDFEIYKSSRMFCCISYASDLLDFPACTEVGALFLLDKDRRIPILAPATSKTKAPTPVGSSLTLQFFRYSQKSSLIILGIAAVSLCVFQIILLFIKCKNSNLDENITVTNYPKRPIIAYEINNVWTFWYDRGSRVRFFPPSSSIRSLSGDSSLSESVLVADEPQEKPSSVVPDRPPSDVLLMFCVGVQLAWVFDKNCE